MTSSYNRYEIGKDFNTKDWFVYDNETDRYICRCDTEEEAERFVEDKCKDVVRYEFEVFQSGTLHYLATWDCLAHSDEYAVKCFISQLNDPSINEDEYDVAFHKALIEKLAGKEYEVEQCEDYRDIIILFTKEELDLIDKSVEM